MIAWLEILGHSLWVLGLATLLATFSLADWSTYELKQPLRHRLAEPSSRALIAVSIALFALGLMLIAGPWWHKLTWAGLFLLCLWEGSMAGHKWSKS